MRRAWLIAGILIALAPASAEAAPVVTRIELRPAGTVTAAEAVARKCSARPLARGTRGADVRIVTARMAGILDVRLDGTPDPDGPDWDLALFGPAGRPLGASAAFGAREVVRAAVSAGDRVTVQACRRGGRAAPVPLAIGQDVVSGRIPPPPRLSLVSIRFEGRRDLDRLLALGIDLNETARGNRVDAVLHGARDRIRLRRAGFSYRTRIADLRAHDRRALARRGRAASASGLPSGRTEYRDLTAYQEDLKAIAEAHPGFVRPVVLPLESVEGRPIEGVEIAEGVERTDDGRPTHVEMGLHHAREWSSGEVVAEFARTLVDERATNPRVGALLRETRTFLLPVINPDGFVAARAAGYNPADDDFAATLALTATGAGSYRRKNCSGTVPGAPCALQNGVDLNRNYGAFWGGPGSSGDPTSQNYRGAEPFSEPEAEAVRRWSSARHVMVLNSNHNYAGTVLYQPGFSREDEPGLPRGTKVPFQDEMRAVANAMAGAAGYTSMVSYDLYDVTGATEDWNYFAQGSFGYTTEVGYDNFHPNYQDAVVDQYLGTVDGSLNQAAGRAPSKGMREALIIAGEAAANPTYHSVLRGTAPAGRTLRLSKSFQTTTSFVDGGEAMLIPERLDTTLTVPPDGRFEWHVNPSTRPTELLAGRTEAWTLTCEDGGQVRETRQVIVGLGQSVTASIACDGSPPPPGPITPGAPAPPPAAAGDAARLRIGGVRRVRGSRRRLVVRLSSSGATALTRLRVIVRDARGRTRARALRRRVGDRARIAVTARRTLRRGRYRIEAAALAPSGRTLRATRTVRLR